MQEVYGLAVRLRALIDRAGIDYQLVHSFGRDDREALGGVATPFPLSLLGLDLFFGLELTCVLGCGG
eukprot:8339803-Pyramimonas_sp.AAC.1